MSDWCTRKLGEFFQIKHGFAFKGKYFTKEGHQIVLTPGNFKEDGGLKSQGDKEKYYSKEPPAEFVLQASDLLIVMTDLTQEARILGSSAFIPENGRYLHNQRLGKVVDLDEKELDEKYLYYLFNWSSVRNQLKATATGATVKHTAPDRIYSVEVPLPSLPVQQKIASILSAYDDLIENNLRRIKILEEMAQNLYREWFIKFRFPGHERVRMVNSALGRIPEGWEVNRLGGIAEEVRRGVPKGKLEGVTLYVGLEHIPRKSLALNAWEAVTELGSNKLIFEPGEILFGKIRPYFHKVSVAPFRGICSADTIVIRSLSEEDSALVTACVSSEEFVAHATATSNGAKMPRANWKVLIEYPVLRPTTDLLKKFSKFFDDVIIQQQNLVQKNVVLRQTRDILLPKLISGELDVSGLEIDTKQEEAA